MEMQISRSCPGVNCFALRAGRRGTTALLWNLGFSWWRRELRERREALAVTRCRLTAALWVSQLRYGKAESTSTCSERGNKMVIPPVEMMKMLFWCLQRGQKRMGSRSRLEREVSWETLINLISCIWPMGRVSSKVPFGYCLWKGMTGDCFYWPDQAQCKCCWEVAETRCLFV